VVSWSSGKDSAFALGEVVREGSVDVVGLLTTITAAFGRVSMHGVREALLDAQAEALGLPVYRVEIPSPCPNEIYEQRMAAVVERLHADHVERMVFGDLFLEDVRRYRESRLASTGIAPMFPLWGRPTDQLARTMISAGVETYLVCVDPRRLPRAFAGRRFDERLLADLPPGVDPCGENGEFHTFVANGPGFRRRVPVVPGEVVERDGFLFADLLPAGA
jgi:uncharacterized protein (TIGR00290 family)